MTYRAFQHNYHDGNLTGFTLGPRRELTLEVDLDPIWNPQKLSASVRFGNIQNYDAVAAFFQALPKPRSGEDCLAGIIGLQYVKDDRNAVLLDLDHYGDIIIHSNHVTELY